MATRRGGRTGRKRGVAGARREDPARFDAARHAERRERLLRTLGDGLLILPTAAHPLRNADTHYDFRPGSDFHYLTGFPEPESVLVATRTGRRRHHAILFVRPRDPQREVWDGRRAGVDGAVERFGVDEAHPIGELFERLPELLGGQSRLFHTLQRDRVFDEALMAATARHAQQRRRAAPAAHPEFRDPLPELAAMRVVKSEDEIACLRRAAEITACGHLEAMAAARPGMAEYQVQAELEGTFRSLGARRNGYSSIVASGANACTLHYVENDRTMEPGDLLLIDAGAEYGMYTADVTRTFPVSGRFSPAQRAVYEVVLRAQKAGIAAARVGRAWNAPHETCVRWLTKGLVELGVLKGRVDALIAKNAHRKWYMHGSSHWLGLDVHDAGAYVDARGKPVRLQAGNVLTIEPGLYFDPSDKSVPKELRGIGVRIEDDVLVTAAGPDVLTARIPKELRDVEVACVR